MKKINVLYVGDGEWASRVVFKVLGNVNQKFSF